MTLVSLPNRPISGDPEDISKIIADFDAILAVLNGDIRDDNINALAAIGRAKLNFGAGLVNADIAAAAAIAISKLAGYPADVTKYLRGDGTWGSGTSATGAELDYAQIIAATAAIVPTTEGTATTIIPGASVAYDGTKNKVEFWAPGYANLTNNGTLTFVLFRDAVVIGQATETVRSGASGVGGIPHVIGFDTPSAANHTYSVKAFGNVASVAGVLAGAGGSGNPLPAFLRVTRA